MIQVRRSVPSDSHRVTRTQSSSTFQGGTVAQPASEQPINGVSREVQDEVAKSRWENEGGSGEEGS